MSRAEGRADELAAEYAKRVLHMKLDPIPEQALKNERDYQMRGWLADFILRRDAAKYLEQLPEGSEAEIAMDALVEVLGTRYAEAAHRAARNALRTILKVKS
jgi:hypothetical protein